MFREVEDEKYRRGQIWSYHTRTGEEKSTILIIGVEEKVINEKQWKVFFHIIINNLQIHSGEGFEINSINSLYFPKEVLENSLDELIGYQEGVPGYLSLNLREESRIDGSGFFGTTIANALNIIEKNLQANPNAWH